MSGGGGGGNQTTTQKADPWSGVQPYLSGMYANAWDQFNKGGPSTPDYVGMNDYQRTALQRSADRSNGSVLENTGRSVANGMAAGNDALSQKYGNILSGNTPQDAALIKAISGSDATGQYLGNVLSGQYLNGNSNLKSAVNAANDDTIRQFNTAVMPQLASQFSLAGRYGSGAQSQGVDDATNNLAKQISNTTAGIYNQNYQNERTIQNGAASTLGNYMLGASGARSSNVQNAAAALQARQNAGLTAIPQFSQIDWNNIQNMAGVGDFLQQQQQGEKNAQSDQRNRQINNINWISSLLSGASPYATQTQTGPGQQSGGLRGALGGAMSGAGAGGSMGGPWGAFAGGIGGGLLGVL